MPTPVSSQGIQALGNYVIRPASPGGRGVDNPRSRLPQVASSFWNPHVPGYNSSLSASPSASSPALILHEIFGYEQFRGPQQAIVDHVVHGGDALVLMPTGGGKSLCYQIPAIARQRAGHGVAVAGTLPGDRGDLVAQRLAAAGRHQHQRVPAMHLSLIHI